MIAQKDFPARYIRTQEAAQFLGLSRRTLEKHRVYGTGPRFLKLGGRVVYKIEDLHSWAERGSRQSTSDPGQGIVLAAKRHDRLIVSRALERAKHYSEEDWSYSSVGVAGRRPATLAFGQEP